MVLSKSRKAKNSTVRAAQPSGAATPRNSDTHKRIAVPKALCVLWEHPRPSPKSGKVCRSTPLATQGFRTMWNAPRVVIPPPPRTIRKYCAQSEKTATSPSCKQITQPSGAATPRDSDAHERIAVPKAFCVLRERPPAKTQKRPSSPFYTLATQSFRNVRNAPRVVIPPPPKTPPVSPCVPLYAIFL